MSDKTASGTFEDAKVELIGPRTPGSVASHIPEDKISKDFSSADADLVLRSSDGISFFVFQRILIEASVVFSDMLTIEFYKSPGGKDVIPTVDITEASETIDSLLRFIYPIRRPVIFAPDIPLDESLTGLVVLLKTADKYQMDGVLFELRTLLMSPPLLKEHPVRVYAIACMYGFDPEAKIASRHTLNVDILRTPLFPELSQITARNYIRLIQLHQARATSALSVLYSMSPSCTGCSKERDGPLWWIEFKERARDELRQRPTSDAIFNASFLARCVVDSKSICPHCPLSYLNAATQARLDHLKERIDQLPDTID